MAHPAFMLVDGYKQLVTRLGLISGLNVTDDPRAIKLPCVLVEAPSIAMHTNVVAEMQFNVVVMVQGQGDNKSLMHLLELVDEIRNAQIGLVEARPTTRSYGGLDYPAYDLTISTKVAP